jgi:prophage regulatory protein
MYASAVNTFCSTGNPDGLYIFISEPVHPNSKRSPSCQKSVLKHAASPFWCVNTGHVESIKLQKTRCPAGISLVEFGAPTRFYQICAARVRRCDQNAPRCEVTTKIAIVRFCRTPSGLELFPYLVAGPTINPIALRRLVEEFIVTHRVIRINALASTPAKPGKLPVSPATIWRWVREGKFPKPFKLGRSVTVWDLDAVEDFLAKRAGDAQ